MEAGGNADVENVPVRSDVSEVIDKLLGYSVTYRSTLFIPMNDSPNVEQCKGD